MVDSLICIHHTKTNMPEGKFRLCPLQCSRFCAMWGDDKVSAPPLRVSPRSMQRTTPSPATPQPPLHSNVPGLLAFLPRPLSNPREEADGPGFLCTNQGGICSLTDMPPLTHVSAYIHYSSSPRWAAVKGSGAERRMSRRRERGCGVGWWVLVMLCFSCWLIPVFKCPSVLFTQKKAFTKHLGQTIVSRVVLFLLSRSP